MAAADTHGAGYEFAQPPAAVPPRRSGYRDPFDAAQIDAPANIMWDRRVVRGSTYASQILTPSQQAEAELAQQAHEASMRRRRAQGGGSTLIQKPGTPEPVGGRRHMDIQTEDYLEELSDKVPEVDETTQTEPFMDRPPTPIFVPAKTGLDKETQIEPGELFDFDTEVEPILEVLVGKTLEQSLMEVHEDLELENIRARQREFEQVRNVELAEVQRLEAEVRRKYAEKRRRKEQESARVSQESQVKEKVAAAAFARSHLSELMNDVFDQLVDDGHFYDPLTREVEEDFLPGIYSRVADTLSQAVVAQNVVDSLIASALERADKMHQAEVTRVRLAREAEERRLAEEAARKKAEEEAAEKARLAAEAAAKAAEEAEEGEDAEDED